MVDISPESKQIQSDQSEASNRHVVLAAKGGGIVFIGQIIAQALQVLMGLVIGRALGAEQFGLYRLGFSFVTLLSLLSLLGLQRGVIRYISVARTQKDRQRIWEYVQIGLIGPGLISFAFGLILFLFAEAAANQIFHEPALTPVLRLFSLYIPISALIDMITSFALGFKKVQYPVYVRDIGARLVKLLLVIILVTTGFGLTSVVITQVVASTMALILLLFLLHSLAPLNRPLHIAKHNLSELMRFSLPLYFSRILQTFGGQLEILFLGFFGMTVQAGIFAAAGSISALSNLFLSSLGSITTPLFAELDSRKEYEQLKAVYQSTAKWAISFSLPYFLTIIFFGELLLSMFGREFTTGSTTLIILVSGALFNALTGQAGPLVNMTGRPKISLLNSFLYLAASIVIDLLLIPRWGIEGAAWAASLTSILINLLRMVEIYIFLRIWPFNWSFLKPIAASLMAAMAGYTINQMLAQTHVILQAALGIFVIWGIYALVIGLLKLSPEDRLILDKLKKRMSLTGFRRQ